MCFISFPRKAVSLVKLLKFYFQSKIYLQNVYIPPLGMYIVLSINLLVVGTSDLLKGYFKENVFESIPLNKRLGTSTN
jgi:hypothetical protein